MEEKNRRARFVGGPKDVNGMLDRRAIYYGGYFLYLVWSYISGCDRRSRIRASGAQKHRYSSCHADKSSTSRCHGNREALLYRVCAGCANVLSISFWIVHFGQWHWQSGARIKNTV